MLIVSITAIVGTLILASFAASASAGEVHVFTKSFGKGELALAAHSGIAVDLETGEVYVADTNNGRIAKFTASGTPDGSIVGVTSPTFIAIDNSTALAGDTYVSEGERTVTKRDATGALVTTWGSGGHMSFTEELLGVAVDPSGNLWVLGGTPGPEIPNYGFRATVTGREFDPAGAPLRSWTAPLNNTTTKGLPLGATVSSADVTTVFAGSTQDESIFAIRQFNPDGTEAALLGGAPAGGAAREQTSDDLYIGKAEGLPFLVRLSPELQEIERFGGEVEGTEGDTKAKLELKSIASLAAVEDGPLYVADSTSGIIAIYGLEEVAPPSVTIESPDSVTQTSAHVLGHVNPGVPSGSPPSHDVRWEFKCTPNCPDQTGYIEVKVDGSEQNVEATLEHLEAGTEYSIALFGKNRGGSSETSVEHFNTAPAPPTAITKEPSEVVRGEAVLNGIVNSNGRAATFHFEYVTRAAFETEGFTGAHSTPESEPLPAPAAPRSVSARIGGLESGTEYFYRVVATNSLGTTAADPVAFRAQVGPNPPESGCPNQAFRTGRSAPLPDCRAFELVTPAEKNGTIVEPYPFGLQAATDGSGVTWFTGQSATGIASPLAGHQGYAFYLSSLEGDGWDSQRLLTPFQDGEVSALVGLTGDGHYALIEGASQFVKIPSGAELEPALYLLDTVDGEATAIAPPQPGQKSPPRAFALDGSSLDDARIFFESHLQLTAESPAGKNNLYMWSRETGATSLVGVLPGNQGEAPAGGSFGGAYSWWGGANLDVGGAERALYVEAVHAISGSGDSVYFTAGETGQIYLRHGLTGTKPTTVRVSVANAGVTDPTGQKPAAFQEATSDGEDAFFISSGKLTAAANTGSSDQGADLYRFDSKAKVPLVDVTPLAGGKGAQVQGLLGASVDGRSGYLVAKGVLTTEGDAVEGDSNIYHFQEGAAGTFGYTFVADLGPTAGTVVENNWSPTAEFPKASRVSSDGETVLFMSRRGLGEVPAGACLIQGPCMQVYRYAMSEGEVACLSCNPTGEGAPLFGAELTSELQRTLVPTNRAADGSAIAGILPANLSISGTQVFFQSKESLLPEDVNSAEPRVNCVSANPKCGDVYEWEAVGSGSCRTANHAGGCLYLLSTGDGDESSYFISAATDGSSAFIITGSPLVTADQDELPDVYDARVDGGLASQQVLPPEPCISSELCKPSAALPPPAAPSGTSSFQGPGNPTRECRKGSLRRHGRCVKKHKKKKKGTRHRRKRARGKGRHAKQHRSSGKRHSGGAK
jgi:NHL repeat